MSKVEIVYFLVLMFLLFMVVKTWFNFILSEIEYLRNSEEGEEE